MTYIFFVYRYTTDRGWSRYSPSYLLQSSYPEWDGLQTIVDNKIETKIPLWKRLGWIEADDTIALDVENEIKDNGIWANMKYITNDEAVLYMQGYTNYPETTPRTFELTPANLDGIDWPAEATYLIIS